MTTSFSGYWVLGTGTTSFVEQTGTGYARQAVTLQVTSARRTQNTAALQFSATGTNWGVITQAGFSATATSPVLFWFTKAVPVTVTNGNSFSYSSTGINLVLPDVFYQAGLTQWLPGNTFGHNLGWDQLVISAAFFSSYGAVVSGSSIPGNGTQIAELLGANCLSTSDQLMVMYANGGYIVDSVYAMNATGNITVVDGGVFAGANKDGGNIVAGSNTTTYSSTLTASNKWMPVPLTTASNTNVWNTPLRVSFTNASPAAGTIDFHVFGKVVS
jgi:hypothetical protein